MYSAIFSSVNIPSANILLAVFIAPSFIPSCKDSFLISSMTLHMIKFLIFQSGNKFHIVAIYVHREAVNGREVNSSMSFFYSNVRFSR